MVNVRQATQDDMDIMNRLMQELHMIHATAVPLVHKVPAPPLESAAYIGELLSNPEDIVLVAEIDGEPAGLVHVRIRTAPDYPNVLPRTYAHMMEIVVLRQYRHRGIGQDLLVHAEKWSAARGATKMQIGVWEFNAEAIEFYERFGYETFSRRMWKDL